MAHFAKIENGIVTQVIVAEQDVINSGLFGDPASWIQTSYNTHNGVHILGGTPLRKNFAGVGYTYDPVADEFNPPFETAIRPVDNNEVTPVAVEDVIIPFQTATESVLITTASETINL
jgi:hypothetical protein